MTLFKNRRPVADDWSRIADDETIGDRTVLSWSRWQQTSAAAHPSHWRLGVSLTADEASGIELAALAHLDLIVIHFAKFTDGRAYSIARLLRETHNYQGELRATGDVLIDQIPLLERCGFDSFEIAHAPTRRILLG